MKPASTNEAANVLRDGGVVLAPTETVVGLLAAGSGLRRLSGIKHRDPEKPIALLCGTSREAFEMASEVPAVAEKLAKRYWPGPLTLVLPKTGGGTIGVRVPDHETVAGLLTVVGEPLYATSANLAGEPAPARLEDVDPRITGAVDAIIGGKTGAGEASAVVDLSAAEPRLLRASEMLTEEDLLRLTGEARNSI